MYFIKWAIKKELKIFDLENGKSKNMTPSVGEFSKFLDKIKKGNMFYFEEGGGDSFKLLARRRGHQVFTLPGIKTKECREDLKIPKTDENDALAMKILIKECPEDFYEFKELDEITARISIIFKERADTEKIMVATKLRLFALKNRLELVNLDGYEEEAIEKKEAIIQALEEDFELQTKLLQAEVRKHPVWNDYLKGIKGIGPVVAGGLITGIKRASRFTDKYALRQYAGMVTKKGNQKFNHQLKKALFYFSEEIIRQNTPIWRKLYDDMKIYYGDKHPDWKKGKINNYAKKFIQTKFLAELHEEMKMVER